MSADVDELARIPNGVRRQVDPPPTSAARRGPPWGAHGRSIPQCNQADSPPGPWPARVAAQTPYELTALAMAGQRHLDPPLAETIGLSRPDLVTLCLGANI